LHAQFKKDKKGLKQFIKWLESYKVPLNGESVCCMEHTGFYNRSLLSFLKQYPLLLWVEMAHHIKNSLGLQRGKTDKIDAGRIALFAYKNRDDIKLWQPAEGDIQQLKDLLAQRERLLQAKVKLNIGIKELKEEGLKEEAKLLLQLQKPAVDGLVKSIERVELTIKKLIKHNTRLQRKVSCMTSVTGIGEVIAWNFLVYTNGFSRLTNGKQLACYCGVVPFQHQSGKSIRGRTRVSHMANKKLKTLLHLGAMVAICYNEQMKVYYKRKLLEGKN
jgi:transposase